MQLNVLLIEDDDEDHDLVRDVVAEVHDVEIELLRERDYDSGLRTLLDAEVHVCLIDLRIGAESGVDFVQKLKAIGCDVPMIILTGTNGPIADQQAMAAGAANFLDKANLNSERLGRVLRYAAGQGRGRRSQPTFSPANGSPDDRPAGGSDYSQDDPMRVLLIEDDEDDYLLTRELLIEVFGRQLQLDWIQSWHDGLEQVFEARHDVVIVDYRLGERNGLELVREAVHLGSHIPFIVLTGEGDREIDLEAMHAGATDYLVKGEISGPLLDRSIRYAIERRKSERRLADLAQIDQLTGLANRYRFREFLERSIARAGRANDVVALMLIDLNRFKAVNDTYGHAAGDLLLQEIAGRLRRSVRPSDLVARLGGDEFTIVVANVDDSDYLKGAADRILDELRKPINIGHCEVDVGASIGIATYPNDAGCADSIIVSADTAMYAGKGQPSATIHFYTQEMHRQAAYRLELERSLRMAMQRDEFELFYQPQVDLRSGHLLGFEALLRWHHPEFGLIMPDEFIELAEESSMILQIGQWVLDTACAQLATWQGTGLAGVHVAVNFSARQFQESGLVDFVADTLTRHDVLPQQLEIEITESDILREPTEAHRLLNAFADIGIRVALDDFGTGYSSLNHLRAFPGAVIKIDRSFINDIETNASNRAIVQSLISMAHDLQLDVVAEGIENTAQLRCLRRLNCDVVQGFLLAKPMPADMIGAELFGRNLLTVFGEAAALAS